MIVNLNVFFLKKIVRYFKNKSAVVAIEFALALPLILAVFGGMVEYANVSYAIQKNISASNMMANIIADLGSLEPHSLHFSGQIAELAMKEFSQTNTVQKLDVSTDTLEDVETNMGIVLTIVAVYPVPTSNPAVFNNQPFIFHQQQFGDPSLITSRFPTYNRGAIGSDVDLAYYNRNKLNVSLLNGLTLVPNQQYVIIESGFTYVPKLNFANILPTTVMRYETQPTVPRQKAFMFLPDGGIGRVIE